MIDLGELLLAGELRGILCRSDGVGVESLPIYADASPRQCSLEGLLHQGLYGSVTVAPQITEVTVDTQSIDGFHNVCNSLGV